MLRARAIDSPLPLAIPVVIRCNHWLQRYAELPGCAIAGSACDPVVSCFSRQTAGYIREFTGASAGGASAAHFSPHAAAHRASPHAVKFQVSLADKLCAALCRNGGPVPGRWQSEQYTVDG